jgi:hypothetical protein
MSKALTELWTLTMGQPPRELGEDLQLVKTWFDPVAQGQRLRRELALVADIPEGLDVPGEPWTLEVGPRRRLVTPEGRCVVDLLESLNDERPLLVFSEAHLVPYDRRLGNLYRTWSRHRLESVVALLAGTTKPLQIPAAGVVISLLVDGCVGEDRALVRFAAESARNVVDRAFFAAVNAFADVLAPSRRGKRDSRLISGWMLYEARRRLGDALVVEDFHGITDGRVYIREDGIDQVVDVVARDLARGHRARANPDRFATAFDALVDALRQELPNLAGFGVVHERPAATRRLRESFVDRLGAYAEQGS